MPFENVVSSRRRTKIAVLGPEVPALWAPFIYEELLGFERRGFAVQPYTVRRPEQPASAQEELAHRTEVIYDRAPLPLAIGALFRLPTFGLRTFKAFSWLVHDMLSVGLYRPIAWKLAYQFLAGSRLAESLVRSGCTHLHVHFASTSAQIAMYASAFSGIPFTITAHANDIFEHGLLLPQKAQRATKLLTISHFNVAYLRSKGVAEDRLAVVRCGVSLAKRPDIPVQLEKATYRIGTLCRLVEKKGVDDLLRALALLGNAPWDVRLCVAGSGPMDNELRKLAGDLGLQDRVEFIGAIDHHKVSVWLRSLDAFVIAAKQDSRGDMDGVPVALMEAMSQGVPVVSTRLSGIPELVVHGQTGLLAEPSDPEGLALEIRRLLGDPESRGRMALAGASHVMDEFGPETNIDRLLGHFIREPLPAGKPAPKATPS